MSVEKAIAAAREGFASANTYYVQYPGISSVTQEYMGFFMKSVTIPELGNTQIQLSGQEYLGIRRNITTGRNYGGPLVMAVLDTPRLDIYHQFSTMMNDAVVNGDQTIGLNRNLYVNYSDKIKKDVQIFKLENASEMSSLNKSNLIHGSIESLFYNKIVTGKWTFINTQPLTIEQISLNTDLSDGIIEWNLSFSYESYSFSSQKGYPSTLIKTSI
tara:strand:- start:313 stop:957 length:645 start_codon:yes stop_codon:yes gene_type:complete